jgi:hypothetical protein
MADILKMDCINRLPQPFIANLVGRSRWPVYDICVNSALLRIDVCGLLEVKSFGDVISLEDADGVIHDAETFYSDYIDT